MKRVYFQANADKIQNLVHTLRGKWKNETENTGNMQINHKVVKLQDTIASAGEFHETKIVMLFEKKMPGKRHCNAEVPTASHPSKFKLQNLLKKEL